MSNEHYNPTADEETPLLQSREDVQLQSPKVTPLPKLQLSVLLLLQLAEPICAMCPLPFINQLVSELDITGGDEKKVGYYAGMIESFFFVAEALCILQWSRFSDHIGRKPVLLIGLFGLAISMILFGLSRTFLGLVLSRVLAGMTNGNVGVIKSMMAEITDSTNLAQAFAFMPIVWSAGVTIGPMAGGLLSRPYDRFPSLFGTQFWHDYPYLLPCLFCASFVTFAFVYCLMFLKETVQKHPKRIPSDAPPKTTSHDSIQCGPAPLRSLMTRPVLLSISNYCALAFVEICFGAIQPLFYATKIEFGGLGLSPPVIGMCLGIFGVMNGVLQCIFFAKLVDRFGPQRIFIAGMGSFIPIFALFPVISQLAKAWGLSPGVLAVVLLQLLFAVVMDMGFGAIFMFITSSAPNTRSLGSVNGMAQTTASIARVVGPTSSLSLFALSLERQWLGGYAVYLVLLVVTLFGLVLATRLPRYAWTLK